MNLHTILTLALAGILAAPVVPAQTCNPAIRPSAPDERFAVNFVKGTVLDQRTGLTWKRCAEGLSGADCLYGLEYLLNWGEALRRAANSNFAGYKDWRLPNIKELESLVEVACVDPALNVTVFPNDPSTFVWASSPEVEAPNTLMFSSRGVNFSDGSSLGDYRNQWDSNLAVRLVRGGQ